MQGWSGKIIYVNLSEAEVRVKPLDQEFAEAFLGGRGFSSKILFDLFDPSVKDPFSPENLVCVCTGLLCGTLAPTSGRFTMGVARSPLTGLFCDGNAGGAFGPELRFAGYDAIVISGVSLKPLYLYIEDSHVELMDASHLWGKEVWETTDMLRRDYGDQELKVLTIGPAGENLDAVCSVMCDYTRAVAGGGVGAVLGSKKLKAIAVRGSGVIELADPEKFEQVAVELHQAIRSMPFYESLSKYGTPILVSIFKKLGALPSYNWQTGVFRDAEKIDETVLVNEYSVKARACYGCPIHCSHFYLVREGEFAGTTGEGPEYEAIGGFGSRCGVSSMPALLHINNLCNRLGIDVIQASSSIALAMHLWQDKILNLEDTGGLELQWGDHHAIIKLLNQMATRQEFGRVLADGALKAARSIARIKGLPEEKLEYYVMHTKGYPHSNVELRGSKGIALAYGVSSRGGDHLRGHATQERYASLGLYKKPEDWARVGVPLEVAQAWYERGALDPRSPDGKALLVIYNENLFAAADALGICKFATSWQNLPFGPDYMAKLVTAATRVEYGWRRILECGERIYNVERVMQARYGCRRRHDYVAPRFFKEPLPQGPRKGEVLSREEYDRMLSEYYDVRGWTGEGLPTRRKLEELDLKDVAEDLARRGILPAEGCL
ncbi:TPA: aldehyde ferredoxin oxidoreductase [Candidatus Bathyarchaeota archaeon]|nr:aldehyde ferredoxin oxidoreductase [Candidatus Bathyarchaeota archaeon]